MAFCLESICCILCLMQNCSHFLGFHFQNCIKVSKLSKFVEICYILRIPNWRTKRPDFSVFNVNSSRTVKPRCGFFHELISSILYLIQKFVHTLNFSFSKNQIRIERVCKKLWHFMHIQIKYKRVRFLAFDVNNDRSVSIPRCDFLVKTYLLHFIFSAKTHP